MKILHVLEGVFAVIGAITVTFALLALYTTADYYEVAVMALILGGMAGMILAARGESHE